MCLWKQHDLCRSLACSCCGALFTTAEINRLAFLAWLVQTGRLDGDTAREYTTWTT